MPNLILEVLPLIVFFSLYYFTRNLYIATASLIILTWLNLLWQKFRLSKINKMTWVNTIILTGLGGLTLLFHKKTFIMLKPTVLAWIIAVIMSVMQIMNKNAVQLLMKEHASLSQRIWNRLNVLWIIFFIITGILNLIVAFNFSEYTWIKFKVFGLSGLMLLCVIVSGIIIAICQGKNAGE
jgi:intracellular septation protein